MEDTREQYECGSWWVTQRASKMKRLWLGESGSGRTGGWSIKRKAMEWGKASPRAVKDQPALIVRKAKGGAVKSPRKSNKRANEFNKERSLQPSEERQEGIDGEKKKSKKLAVRRSKTSPKERGVQTVHSAVDEKPPVSHKSERWKILKRKRTNGTKNSEGGGETNPSERRGQGKNQ